MIAEPSATEVTRPADDTVATAAADVVHVTVAPLIVAPFWSLTVAEIWDVTPREARLRLVTERVIEVATGVGGGVGVVGVVGESPPQLHNNSEHNRALNGTVVFMPAFCPIPLRPATQDVQNTVGRCVSMALARLRQLCCCSGVCSRSADLRGTLSA